MIINYYIARTRKGWQWAWLWRWDLFVAFATAFVFIIPTCFLFLFFFCVFVSSCCPHLIFPRPKKRNHFISRCFHYSTEIHILGSDLHLCSFVFFLLWILKRPCSVGMLDSVCAKLFPGLPYYTHISVSLKGLGKKKEKSFLKEGSINLSKWETMFFIRKVVRRTCDGKLPLLWKFPRRPLRALRVSVTNDACE